MTSPKPPTPDPAPETGSPKKTKKRWVLPAIGAIAVVIVISALVNGGGSDDAGPGASETTSTAAEGAAKPAAQPEAEAPADPLAWYKSEFPMFEPVVQSGTGPTVIPLPAEATAGIATTTHEGSGHFAVKGLDATNSATSDLLVNTIGNYAGTTAYGLDAFGEPATSLQIEADGAWTITISPIASAPELTTPAANETDGVYLFQGEASTPTITHNGEGHFAVKLLGASGSDLAVNTIGAYTGTVPVKAGPAVVVVQADGPWTIG